MKLRTWCLASLILLVSCAVVKAPGGGPEDKIPPAIAGIIPGPESTGIAGNSKVIITFTEKVDEESFKNRIITYPPLEFEKIDVKGVDVVISFKDDLPDTTICLLLKSGFKDHHLVINRENHIFFFSTLDSLDPGEISGKILFKQRPDSNGVAKIVQLKGDTLTDIFSEKESRISFADGFGNYIFKSLPADSARFLLWSFTDRDGDGRYSEGKEFAVLYPDTILISGNKQKLSNLDMNVIDPDEPGSIKGKIGNATGFPLLPLIRFDNILAEYDPIIATADTSGSFFARRIKPGSYIYSAFIDINADSLPGKYIDPEDSTRQLEEPAWHGIDTLRVAPGEEKIIEPIKLIRKKSDEN